MKKKLNPALFNIDRKFSLSLLKQDRNSSCLRCGYVVLKKNESVGQHCTDRKEEIIVVLEGKARVYLNRKPFVLLKKNSVMYVPVDTIHDVKNIGRKSLRYIYITCRVK